VYLDDANSVADLPTFSELLGYKKQGINIWAPPLFALLTDDGRGNIVASQWAKDAGLELITWTLEPRAVLIEYALELTELRERRCSHAAA